MPVTDVQKDPNELSLTITAEFDAPPARAWRLWSDPRQLERWWGPPTWPATFVDHDLVPGARCTYFMTGPEGDRAHGGWSVRTVDEPASLEFDDWFADDAGAPNPDLPTTKIRVELEPLDEGRTRMSVRSVFPSTEAMEQMLEMGMDEGMSLAMNQIDGLLTESA